MMDMRFWIKILVFLLDIAVLYNIVRLRYTDNKM